jgi:hypothetical protein
MQSWKIRLGLMLAMLAMLLMVSVSVAVADDDDCDDGHWDSDRHEWVCDDDGDDGDDEDFDGIEIAEFDLDAEVVCFLDADADGWSDEDWADGLDNDGDWEIDEDDIDCEIVWDD